MCAFEIIRSAHSVTIHLNDARRNAGPGSGIWSSKSGHRHLDIEGLQLLAILKTYDHAEHVDKTASRSCAGKSQCSHRMTGAFQTRRIVPRAARKSPLSHFGSEFEIMKIPGHTKSRRPSTAEPYSCRDTLFAVGCAFLSVRTPKGMYDSVHTVQTEGSPRPPSPAIGRSSGSRSPRAATAASLA
jgi:hypothetical protein